MRKDTAEFRIAVQMTDWNDTPVICEKLFTEDNDDTLDKAADLHAARIVNIVGREVRWNWRGSSQGHYIRPMR